MALQLSVHTRTKALPAADVVAVFADRQLDVPLQPAVLREARAHAERVGFTGGDHETRAIPLSGKRPQALFLIGTGKSLVSDLFRRGVAATVRYAKAEGARTAAVVAPDQLLGEEPAGYELGRVFGEGALLANYHFTAYSSEAAKRERRSPLTDMTLLVPRTSVHSASEGARRASVEAEGVMLARNLVNEPSSRMTPAALTEQAEDLARSWPGVIELRVWNREECERRGMGAFLAVARGSAAEPQFLHLTYRPGRSQSQAEVPRVALVGKGITFDSGGLSIKTAEGMETMKIDMAGAATVLGVFSVLPSLKLPVEVHGFIAACENMPSGTAVKPGDIVRTVSGKTIEVLNTDAEGRLTLADALSEALTVKPHAVIDCATLTGACVVSLGEEVAGLFSNDDTLARSLEEAAAAAGEPVWRLPLVREYRDRMKSEIADLKNVSGRRWGGAITAALFLQEFVPGVPWAHLDIAGPSYAERLTNPVIPVGGTGFGVRTLLRYLERLSTRTAE